MKILHQGDICRMRSQVAFLARRYASSLLACVAAACLSLQKAAAHELTIAEALTQAEQYSPRLKSARLQEQAAHKAIGVARSAYYPSVAGDGIDSWGFPGSSGYLGIGGLMGSPYRSGEAAGLVARGTVFDFGRTYSNVRTSEYGERAQREATQVDRYLVDQDALQTFFECSRFHRENEIWDNLHGETEIVAREVERFVNTGQRSIVDKYLSQAQVEEARTERNYFKSRMDSTLGRLVMLMGSTEKDFSCPSVAKLDGTVSLYPTNAANPYVLQAQTEVDLARNRLLGAKTDFLPKIVGVASAGAMDKTRLVHREDYSAGLGVILPLFDGLGTVYHVAQAKADLEAKREALGAVQLQMDEINAKYDEIIDASKARLEHLTGEEKLAQEGFKVAKNRYFKFQGTLVDLRDALRNLGRIETDMGDTQANFLEALGAKALLNGSLPRKP